MAVVTVNPSVNYNFYNTDDNQITVGGITLASFTPTAVTIRETYGTETFTTVLRGSFTGAGTSMNTVSGTITGIDEGAGGGLTGATISGLNFPWDALLAGTTKTSDLYSGNDAFFGASYNDRFAGYLGNDTAYGGGGTDVMYGNQGGDVLYGDAGNDTLFGGQGGDLIFGGADADVIYGNMMEDTISGAEGNDTIFGGQGDDRILGEAGNDVLAGNLGADRFVFATGQGNDQIRGFNADQGDRIELAAGMTYTTGAASDGSTILALSGGGTVTLVGIAPTAFNAAWVLNA
ncbi:calcium-binding protein [Azospirillum sp.]|uniref:calcium-binding protein n=1 Tax=Azospirillum sp. TaxID=34012 RepID=UPI002D43A19C|nr:calcium-binding protein [Azospirillum sp.]HYD66049.1 calcium-binding protein [Azospirillum sp.]